MFDMREGAGKLEKESISGELTGELTERRIHPMSSTAIKARVKKPAAAMPKANARDAIMKLIAAKKVTATR